MEKLEWHNDRRRVGDLVPYEHNPRILTEKQAKDLERSLKKFNLVEIPAINLDGKIIAGHQRCKTMIALGMENDIIDVRIPNRMLTEAEFKEYNIRSNKNVAEWDFSVLNDNFDLGNLKDWGFEDWEFGIEKPIDIIKSENLSDSEQKTKTNKCPNCGHEF
jgi:hypothetical protein